MTQSRPIEYAGTQIQKVQITKAATWAFALGVSMWATAILCAILFVLTDRLGRRSMIGHTTRGLLIAIFGLLVILGCLLGIINGIEAVRQPTRRRWLAIVGLVLCTALETIVIGAAVMAAF